MQGVGWQDLAGVWEGGGSPTIFWHITEFPGFVRICIITPGGRGSVRVAAVIVCRGRREAGRGGLAAGQRAGEEVAHLPHSGTSQNSQLTLGSVV